MKKISPLLLVGITLLSSCSNESYEIEDYMLYTEYKSDYRILQLTDTHIGNKDNRKVQYEYLDSVIQEANADMIIVTGDLFTFADKITAKEFFDFLDSYGKPWTVTFGNHDEQAYFSVDWMTNYLNNYGSNCLFIDNQNDGIMGYANFTINLMKGNDIFEQLVVLDSNRYSFGKYQGYDWIKEEQIVLYEKMINFSKTYSETSKEAESIAFYHIPVPEFATAYELAKSGSSEATLEYGEMRETCSCPKYNSGFFDKAVELGSTKAMLVGHDHVNNARILYKGIRLTYGITSTDRIYFDEDMMGGQVVVLHDDRSLTFEQIYKTYKEN